MKKKIIISICLLVILIGIMCFFVINKLNSSYDIYLSDSYGDAIILTIEEAYMIDNTTGVIIVDTSYNNTVSKKDNYLKLIEYFIGVSGKPQIKRTKTISNKRFEEIKEKINNISHYYGQIDSPCYTVTYKGEKSFMVKVFDFNIKDM